MSESGTREEVDSIPSYEITVLVRKSLSCQSQIVALQKHAASLFEIAHEERQRDAVMREAAAIDAQIERCHEELDEFAERVEDVRKRISGQDDSDDRDPGPSPDDETHLNAESSYEKNVDEMKGVNDPSENVGGE